MIYGIGTDICDIRRIRASLERHGERFAHKVLHEAELAIWHARAAQWPERGVRYLATRFSAKEAFSKALGTGVRPPATLSAIAVLHDHLGKPMLGFSPALHALLDEKNLKAHLSISDEAEYAVAYVILEQA